MPDPAPETNPITRPRGRLRAVPPPADPPWRNLADLDDYEAAALAEEILDENGEIWEGWPAEPDTAHRIMRWAAAVAVVALTVALLLVLVPVVAVVWMELWP